MTSNEIKDKIESGEFVEDYLPVYTDLPPGQGWQVVNYIDYNKPVAQAFEELAMIAYISKCEPNLLDKIRENRTLFSEQYKSFKSISYEYLNNLFVDIYGSDYDRHRIWCSFGSYPTAKMADAVMKKLASESSSKYGGFDVIQNGYYVPFKPTPEMCSNYESTNKIMNDYMKGQLENMKERKAIFEERKKALMHKNLNDAKARGTNLTTKKGEIEEVTDFNNKFARFNPANLIGLKVDNQATKQKLEAMQIIKDEIMLGNFDRINLQMMKKLGFTNEQIENVESKQSDEHKILMIQKYIENGEYSEIDVKKMEDLKFPQEEIDKVKNGGKQIV